MMDKKPHCSEDGLNKRAWTALEDELLVSYINSAGEGKWTNVPKNAGLKRCGKSCRLRWLNYLRPNIKRGNISEEEEELINRLHKLLGNRWSLIAGRLPGRTDNEIKNYWNTTLSKKVQKKSFTINMQWMLKSKPQENNISSSSSSPPSSIPGLIRAEELQNPSSTAGVIDQISHQSFGEEMMEKKEDGTAMDGGDLLSFDDSLWFDGLEFEGWINGDDDGIMNGDVWLNLKDL